MLKLDNKRGDLLRAAIVGVGRQAISDHLPGIINSENAELVALCDINPYSLTDIGTKLRVPTYTSVDELLNTEKLDFIIVSSSNNSHKQIIEKAAAKGIHILKEKPFAISLKEAMYLKRLSEEKGIHIMTALKRRFNAIYYMFFQFIDKIGTPFMVDIKYSLHVSNPHEGWRGNKEQAGGGCILDMGYHMIDLLIWYFGLPSEVHAEMSCLAKPEEYYDAEDTANILFRYNTGLHGTMRLSRFIAPKEECIKISGSEGIIEIQRDKIVRYDTKGIEQDSMRLTSSGLIASSKQIDYFCKIISEGKMNPSNPDFHLKHLAFIEACYKSKNSGSYEKVRNILEEKWLKI